MIARAAIALAALIATAAPASAAPCTAMQRTELLMSSDYNDGKPIAASDWRDFLAREVTPRFPDGLTVLDGYGQWKRPDGRIERSRSHILLIWHGAGKAADARIEAIRTAYRKRFRQLSVMRVDGQDCVSF